MNRQDSGALLLRYWPVITVLAVIAGTFAVAQSQIRTAADDIGMLKTSRSEDHEALLEMRGDLKLILYKLDKLDGGK